MFDTQTKKWGSVRVGRHDIAAIWVAFFSRWQRYCCSQAKSTSEGAALMGPPGCPQERGLPFNCFSPNVAVNGDEVLIHSGECAPFELKGVHRWHYPTTALSAKVTPIE